MVFPRPHIEISIRLAFKCSLNRSIAQVAGHCLWLVPVAFTFFFNIFFQQSTSNNLPFPFEGQRLSISYSTQLSKHKEVYLLHLWLNF